MVNNDGVPDGNFKPWGAVAFFVVLMVIIVGIWFSMYALMLSRS
jgi:hypothetical protein